METTKLNTVRLKDGSEYPLSARWNDLTDKPFHSEQTALFSDATLTFGYTSTYGGYIYQSDDAEILGKWAAVWSHACVTVDGVRYRCKKQSVNGLKYIGDGLRIMTGTSVSGEPFATGVTQGAFLLLMFVDSVPEDTSATVEHTVSITLENDVIQSDYLPSVPEFDLTAMGLAAVSVGGSVSVACDTAALRAALDKGNVKLTLSYQAGAGITAQVTLIGPAMEMSGTYQLSFVGALGSTPLLFNVEVTDTAISAQIITLAVPAASADTASTGATG